MDERDVEREAGLFTRYESRIVQCELEIDRFSKWIDKYEPIVDGLRDRDMLAREIAKQVGEQRRNAVTKVTVAVALLALFVPPFLTFALVRYLGKG